MEYPSSLLVGEIARPHYVLVVLALLLICSLIFFRQKRFGSQASQRQVATKDPSDDSIEPLIDFDWENTPPKKFRPFKPTYHITLGLQSTTPSELITIDNDYKSRVLLRRSLLQSQGPTVHGYLPEGIPPVMELYTYLLGRYLPRRYPSIFHLRTTPTSRHLHNTVTGVSSPLEPPPSPADALRIIGETIEEDCFLLLPQEQGGHRCVGFLCCFAGGFDPSVKLGGTMGEIHGPVPGWEKIGGSVERVFGRLSGGRGWRRVNWSVQTDDVLFKPKAHKDEVSSPLTAMDIDKVRLRCEVQTLTRLLHTNAILFSFKTYMYPISDIKDEGLGPALAEGIDGLKKGNVPEMWAYKGVEGWKDVREYLRG